MMRVIVLAILGAFVLSPICAQELHLRSLAATGTVEEIREALKSSCELTKPDKNGVSALMVAAGSNHDPNVISLLVAAGADVNARNKLGETALICAAQSNPNPDVAKALLASGAALDDRDGLGRTALMAAAWGNGNPAVASALLTAGADANAKSRLGKTALDYARDNPRFQRDSDAWRALESATKQEMTATP
ncbi:MAG: ankyrin repeat domain-containing protein [Spirochaetia bacterium]|jgi:ankyrin repeat protein